MQSNDQKGSSQLVFNINFLYQLYADLQPGKFSHYTDIANVHNDEFVRFVLLDWGDRCLPEDSVATGAGVLVKWGTKCT